MNSFMRIGLSSFLTLMSFTSICQADSGGFTIDEQRIFNAKPKLIEPFFLPSPIYKDVLDPAISKSWRKHGYALVDGLFPPEFIAAVKHEAQKLFPDPGSHVHDFGGISFPFNSRHLNAIPLNTHLIKMASQLLRSKDILLKQAELWAKRGRTEGWDQLGERDNDDQRMHMDYPNHNLLHPPKWDKPDLVSFIIYLDDASECEGATAVVPRQGHDDPLYQWPYFSMPGVQDHPWLNNLYHAELYFKRHHPKIFKDRLELYKNQVSVHYKPGTVLVYRHDVWHRGTPVKAGKTRLVINLTYSLAKRHHIGFWHASIAKSMYRDPQSLQVEKIIANLIKVWDSHEDALAVLGVPRRSDPYWSEDPDYLEVFLDRYLPSH